MVAQPRGPKKTHKPRDGEILELGVFVAGKGFSDGEGGYLNREQYDAAVKELEAHKKLKRYIANHGIDQ